MPETEWVRKQVVLSHQVTVTLSIAEMPPLPSTDIVCWKVRVDRCLGGEIGRYVTLGRGECKALDMAMLKLAEEQVGWNSDCYAIICQMDKMAGCVQGWTEFTVAPNSEEAVKDCKGNDVWVGDTLFFKDDAGEFRELVVLGIEHDRPVAKEGVVDVVLLRAERLEGDDGDDEEFDDGEEEDKPGVGEVL